MMGSQPSRRSDQAQLVTSPVRYQGVRDALLGAFCDALDTPPDFEALLARIR